MSANNDNAMTRFLFAILRQKNLKDIDWNQVAQDPILSQPITNGHAARMRYSRFRSSMLGLEPTRRNRPSKGRVTKSTKKDTNFKESRSIKEDSASPEPATGSSHSQKGTESMAPRVKRENSQYGFDSRFTPGFTPGLTPAPIGVPTMPNSHFIHPRLLTPCSDTDTFASPSAMSASPSADLMHSQNTFDMFNTPCHSHDDMAWQNVGGYSAFDAAYPYDFNNATCDHHHMHHDGNFVSLPLSQSIEIDDDMPPPDVKKEN